MKELIEAVKAIDPEAAEYLEKEVWPNWEGTKLLNMAKAQIEREEYSSVVPDLLTIVLNWECSPQKEAFWMDLYLKMPKSATLT